MQQLQCTFVTGNSVEEIEVSAILNVKTGEVELIQELALDFHPNNEYIEINGEREALIREGNILRVNELFMRTLLDRSNAYSSPKRSIQM